MVQDITFWTTIAGAAGSIIATIISIIKSTQKSKNEKLVKLAKVVKELPQYITESEQIFGAGHGTAKLAYVLNKVQMQCITHQIEYNEDDFKYEIEKILDTPQKNQTT